MNIYSSLRTLENCVTAWQEVSAHHYAEARYFLEHGLNRQAKTEQFIAEQARLTADSRRLDLEQTRIQYNLDAVRAALS